LNGILDGFQLILEHQASGEAGESSSEQLTLLVPNLTDCSVPVSDIVDKLTAPPLIEELVCQLAERSIQTVHDLNMLSEADIADLSVREPKVATVKTVLNLFTVILPLACDLST
jgi:hypothetical protein